MLRAEFSADGTQIVSGSVDYVVNILKIAEQEMTSKLELKQGKIDSLGDQ